MLMCYRVKGNEKEFVNTFSGFDSAINGFSKECRRVGAQRGVDPKEIAGKELFLTTMNYECNNGKRTKTCGSIKEMERWITQQNNKQTGGGNSLQNLDIRVKCEVIPEDESKIIVETITQPMFFAQAKVKSKLMKELFEKKTKNWMVELI